MKKNNNEENWVKQSSWRNTDFFVNKTFVY